MASNKNQHFVPRCYLRPFSQNEGKTISLYNIDRDKAIFDSALKNQCSRDYFYGKDDNLERAIQQVERLYASLLPHLLQPGFVLNTDASSILFRFWLLQHHRTEAASIRMAQMTNEANGLLGDPGMSVAIEIKQAVQISMQTFADYMYSLDDLKIVLIENKTDTPFITSDDPAVMVNRFADSRRFDERSYGLNAAGLICLLPLSPKVYCMFYDDSVYSIKSKNNWTSIKSTMDVDSLNATQYLNCFANLYFKEKDDSGIFSNLRNTNRNIRPVERYRIHYAIKTKTENDHEVFTVVDKKNIPAHTHALLHLLAVHIKPRNWPGFLRWRPGGYYYSNKFGRVCVRKAHVVSRDSYPYMKVKTGQ